MAYLCIVGSLLCVIVNVQGHGLLLDPPGRSSLWREGYDVEINYQDNELFCGGFQNQWEEHDGKCGLCGDPWQGPRENEAGGKYATDIIPRSYKPGSVIDVKVDLTANHLGWFEFSLCANNNWMKNFTEDCLQLLELADDGRSGTRYTISDRTGIYDIKLKLPDQLTCSQCVIQWKYHTANSWGVDADGTGCMGCGAQEEFYSCADIAISENGGTTSGPATTSESTQTTVTDNWTTTVSEATTQNPDVTSILPENCRATGPWEGQIDVTDWCIRNCALGNCPTDVCLCD